MILASFFHKRCLYISALKSSLKTAKRLQLDRTKTAKDWTCSLGLSVLRLEDCKKTGCGGPVLSIKSGLLYPSNYPSKRIQEHIFRTKADEDILKTVKYFIQMVDVPEYFCTLDASHINLNKKIVKRLQKDFK